MAAGTRRLRWGRVLVVLVVAATLVLPGTGPAGAQGDTSAVAVNTGDGTSLFRFAFAIRRTMNDVVDQTNVAAAYASCDSCKAVALSIQIVLVMSDPNIVTPTNLALALTYDCTACEVLASAYQFVLGTDGVVRFTAEGNQALAELRGAFRDLLREDLPVAELQARIDQLVDQLYNVLDTLVSAGPPEEGEESYEEPEGSGEESGPSPAPNQEDPTSGSSPAPVETATGGAEEPSTNPSSGATSDGIQSPVQGQQASPVESSQ